MTGTDMASDSGLPADSKSSTVSKSRLVWDRKDYGETLKAQKRAEYLRNKEKYLARAKKWAVQNPDKRKAILAKNNAKSADRKRKWAQLKNLGTTVKLNECKLCSITENLVVHHRGGNNGKMGKPLNNDVSNLAVLCRSCHAKIHRLGEIKVYV